MDNAAYNGNTGSEGLYTTCRQDDAALTLNSATANPLPIQLGGWRSVRRYLRKPGSYIRPRPVDKSHEVPVALNVLRSRRNPRATVEPALRPKLARIRAPKGLQAIDCHGWNHDRLLGLENDAIRGLSIGKREWRREWDYVVTNGLSN
jgi:hypothetical protein